MSALNRQRGLLRLESDLQSQTHVADDARLFALPASGVEEAAGKVASGLGAVAAKVGALADHAATTEGREAGRIAGLDPEFRPSRSMTLRGEAFDRAGLETHLTHQRIAIQADLAQAELAHGNDPAQLNQVIQAKRQAWLQSTLPELQPDISALFAREHLTMMRSATRRQLEMVHHEAAGAATTDIAQSLRRMHQRAYQLGLDGSADEVLAGDLIQLRGLLGRRGPDGRPLISPEQAARLITHANEEVSTARIRGAFDRMPSIEAREAFLARFREDYAAGRGVAGAYDIQGFHRVESEMEAEIRRLRTGDGVALREITGQIQGVLDHAARGYRMPPEDIAALRARILQSRDPALVASLEQAEGVVQFVQGMRQSSPLQIDTWLRTERARLRAAATPAERVRLDQMQALATEMHTQLAQDPLGWAERVGLIQVAPLDFGQQDFARLSLRGRIAQAAEVSRLYGVRVNPLRRDEVAALSARMAEGGGAFLGVAAMLADAAGPDAPAVLQQLHAQGSGGAALLGSLAAAIDPRNPSTFVRDAADGMALMRNRGTTGHTPAVATNNERRNAALDVVGDALSGANAGNIDNVMTVANWAYEVHAARHGLTTFDPAAYRRLVAQALGQQTIGGRTYGGIAHPQPGWFSSGSGVVIPPYVRQDTFRELLDNLTEADLGTMPVMRRGGPPATLAQIRGARLITIGPGEYNLAVGMDGDRPALLQAAGGGDYVLSLGAVARTLRPRRPHFFLGGGQ